MNIKIKSQGIKIGLIFDIVGKFWGDFSKWAENISLFRNCLLYTSDAADE